MRFVRQYRRGIIKRRSGLLHHFATWCGSYIYGQSAAGKLPGRVSSWILFFLSFVGPLQVMVGLKRKASYQHK